MDRNYMITNTFVVLNMDDKVVSFPFESEAADHIIKAISNKQIDKAFEYAFNYNSDLKNHVMNNYSHVPGLRVTDTNVYVDGLAVNASIANQIKKFYYKNLPTEPLVKFIQKLRKNPSKRIRSQLYAFITECDNSGGFVIDKDGDIIGYKKITNTYKDIYTKKIDNSVGQTVTMNRDDVNPNPNEVCSAGLHFCAFSYLERYASDTESFRIVLVKVNPEDVVSIPNDYNNAKARCCKYTVIEELKTYKPLTDTVYEKPFEKLLTEDDIAEFAAKNNTAVMCELYRKITKSNTPKKFESKAVGIKRLSKAIFDITDENLYKSVCDIIKG